MESERNLRGGEVEARPFLLFHTFHIPLARDDVIASLNLQICKMLSPRGLLCVILGLLAGVISLFFSCLFCFLFGLFFDFLRPIINKLGQPNALIDGTCCIPMERVDRPGKSQEATGRKKVKSKVVPPGGSSFCPSLWQIC